MKKQTNVIENVNFIYITLLKHTSLEHLRILCNHLYDSMDDSTSNIR